jgi:hypothetical protein
MCYGSFVLVIKISAIRILARRSLPAIRLAGRNLCYFSAIRVADFDFFAEIRSSITFKSLL